MPVRNSAQGILSDENIEKRNEIVELLKKAYWMEIETVMSYISNSINPDGVRAQEIVESLQKDIQVELGHAHHDPPRRGGPPPALRGLPSRVRGGGTRLSEEALITPYRDGPLLVRGPFRMEDQHGNQIEVGRDTVALCRCGKSRIRPFCDGTHKVVRFRAPSGQERGR